jgi:hypothetical protein
MSLNYVSAQEAAALVKNNDNVGFSGFTHAGCPKVVPVEIAKRAEEEHAKGILSKLVFSPVPPRETLSTVLFRVPKPLSFVRLIKPIRICGTPSTAAKWLITTSIFRNLRRKFVTDSGQCRCSHR